MFFGKESDSIGVEGSLPFRFENFGTFGGPQFSSTNYDFDKFNIEGVWPTTVPGDYTFRNSDLGVFLYNNALNYVGFHCDGVSTAQMTLEHSAGPIPIFNIKASTTNVVGKTLNVTGNINATGNIVARGTITQHGLFNLTGVGDVAAAIKAAALSPSKGFDMHHPTKDGWRLAHTCIEGPEAAVYYRGKLRDKNVIELPEYWKGLVDIDTITVNLTPFGSYQELFVEKIESETKIFVKNNLDGPISCDYTIWGERKDLDKLYVEYEGRIEDYPGDNSQRSIVGYNYDKREGIN